MLPDDLDAIEGIALRDHFSLVPTIFLARKYIPIFRRVLERYFTDLYPRILGFAVEGPMLSTTGGVPPAGCWVPTGNEWMQIAELGELGLEYMVIGPDAVDLDDEVADGLTFRSVIDAFYRYDVKLALGHFRHNDPETSARRTREVIEYVQCTYGPSPYALITDHLFNDMPRNFVHAWRTPAQRKRRDREVAEFLDHPWTDEELDKRVGPVPATLLRAAARDQLVPALNFDGEHVDLAICRRVVDYLGSLRLIAITDHTETDVMAGEPLHTRPGSTLLYRHDGVVAAGSSSLDTQRRNMRSIGLSDEDVSNLFDRVPRQVLAHRVRPMPS